ncbi:hypothetical protein IEE94_07655 [Yimella sp. cx-573]|nr:hypothetical protein [Yimella sp. cx-573]
MRIRQVGEGEGVDITELGKGNCEHGSTLRARVGRWLLLSPPVHSAGDGPRFAEPITDRDQTPRNELAIKLALAVTLTEVDVQQVVQIQRTATMRQLRDLTRLKVDAQDDLAWSLVLDNLIFQAEAEIRWLDHIEARVSRARNAAQATQAPATVAGMKRTRKQVQA